MRSLIGELPEGWRQAPLGSLCDLVTGPGIPAQVFGGDVPVVKPRNIGDGRLIGPVDRVPTDVAAGLFRYRLAAGDVLCVRTGNPGRHALVTTEHEEWLFGTGLIRLRPGGEVLPPYLNHYLGHPLVGNWFERNTTGSAVPSISGRALGALPVAVPPLDVQAAIGGVLEALNEKIAVHDLISRTTAELRDALLVRLLKGG
ncbi:restriction endonuclease subunit S [Streptosporangium pseudovulgare]|uniref:Type I restriction modification DNA specificity domain-containing protein n=1 Tax=Streptosporangium pseudovulgare TaxID=35765 RepID=A0ABQ2QZW7_9ACTN|nr:restriction endonuclease subunit S [Streptosporangium pseudovulgare]GGQ02970.1 hypothetical protein GCM10010140_36540 [Streptosporangium pseudovulgare]